MRRWLVFVALLGGTTRAQDAGVDQWLADLSAWRPNADDAYARLQAAGPDVFAKVLSRLLDDQSDRVKLRLAALLAGYAAAMESTEPHVADLKKLLSEKNPEVLATLCPVFSKAGASMMPALERLFASPDAGVRAQAGRALGTFGPAAFPMVRKNLAAASAFRCEAALFALYATGDAAKEFAPEVRSFLAHKNPGARAAAALAYGAIAPDRNAAATALIPLLGDPAPGVRQSAEEALERHATERLRALTAAVAAARGEPRQILMGILRRLPATVGPAYVKALLAAPPSDRAALLDASPWPVVAEFDPGVCDELIGWAADPDLATRVAIVRLLGLGAWPDPKKALAVLRAAAKAPDAEMRVEALRGIASDAAMARELSSDPDPVVRMEAACVLLKRHEAGPDPLPLCVALLDQSPAAAQRIGEMRARGLPAVQDLVRIAESPMCGDAARRALALVLDAPPADGVIGRPFRMRTAPEAIMRPCQRALQWLADAQEGDGRWDGVRWGAPPFCDCGLTGLALLAFLSAGQTDVGGPHAAVVQKALIYLEKSQADDGCVPTRATSTFMIQHAIATTALAEAACVCRRDVRTAAMKALQFASMARNPAYAWRYDPRGGENDTFVTTWMVMALKAGEAAGLHLDRAAYEGALCWVVKMTDPNFGNAGYNYPGGSAASPKEPGSAETEAGRIDWVPEKTDRLGLTTFRKKVVGNVREKTDACTAAGLWVRVLAGSQLDTDVEVKGIDLLTGLPPVWDTDEGTVDECYWHWGCLVATQCVDAPRFSRFRIAWRRALEAELPTRQAPDGSWDPIGVWGRTGGRAFSTSMAVLTLLAPYAYPEGCFRPDYRRKLHPEAFKLLGR